MTSEPKGRAESLLEREVDLKFLTSRFGAETLDVCLSWMSGILFADSRREAANFRRRRLSGDLQAAVPRTSRTGNGRHTDLGG